MKWEIASREVCVTQLTVFSQVFRNELVTFLNVLECLASFQLCFLCDSYIRVPSFQLQHVNGPILHQGWLPGLFGIFTLRNTHFFLNKK